VCQNVLENHDVFKNANHLDLLEIYNGQYAQPVGDSVSLLFNGATIDIGPDDPEWTVGAFTAANSNNTDVDQMNNAPLADGWQYEQPLGGVIKEHSQNFNLNGVPTRAGRDELDLIRLDIDLRDLPPVGMGHYRWIQILTVRCHGLWGDSTKANLHPGITGTSNYDGYKGHTLDPSTPTFTFWWEIDQESQALRDAEIAIVVHDFGMTGITTYYDRAHATGVWALEHGPRILQGSAVICEDITVAGTIEVDTMMVNFAGQAVVGQPILLDRGLAHYAPVLAVITGVTANASGTLTLVLDTSLSCLPVNAATFGPGHQVLIGPNASADSWYWKYWSMQQGGGGSEHWQGKLASGHQFQSNNGAEFKFQIMPEGAHLVELPDGQPLMHFDITRTGYWEASDPLLGLLGRFETPGINRFSQFGSEWTLGDSTTNNEDCEPTQDGWIFSTYISEFANNHPLLPAGPPGDAYPRSPVAPGAKCIYAINVEATVEAENWEFVRLKFGDDFLHSGGEAFPWTGAIGNTGSPDAPQGSRCSAYVRLSSITTRKLVASPFDPCTYWEILHAEQPNLNKVEILPKSN